MIVLARRQGYRRFLGQIRWGSMNFTSRLAVAVGAGALGWATVHVRSPAVRGWRADHRTTLPPGPLAASTNGVAGGDRDPVVVLLHGIVGSGRSFGATYDDISATVVVPDLLGFGRSMEVDTSDYSVGAHVDAVRQTLDGQGLGGRPVVVVGHSMGGVLALHLGAALPDTRAVVAIDAPLYDTVDEGLARIGKADPLASLVATGGLAERICAWMCAHRRVAGLLWPVFAIRWPIPVAADGVLHTWPAYRGSLDSLVLHSGYRRALDVLTKRDVPVWLVNGSEDGVPVDGRARALAATHENAQAIDIEGGDHSVPLSHPQQCLQVIEDAL